MMTTILTQVGLIGDSDIAYWPSELYPTQTDSGGVKHVITSVSGHSGATLRETLPHLHNMMKNWLNLPNQERPQRLILIACAGENDIGNGICLDDSVQALETFIDVVFEDSNQDQGQRYLIFLGPKFEPWMNDDPTSKKQYTKMSRSFARCCDRSNRASKIHYVDCITMFCSAATSSIPGAILGGKAMADSNYFCDDQLHLSKHGYQIWKDVVEKCIVNECMI